MKTQAAILVTSKQDLVIDEIEINNPLQEGQVLVEINTSGICGAQINEIDAGIEPGLSMASSGENMSRGLDRSMVTSPVKYSRDPKKKTIKELTGDETTMSIGDKKEDDLKKVGINLSSFKAKKFVG